MLRHSLSRSLRAGLTALVSLGALLALPGHAALTSYTLGPDGLGIGRVFTSLDSTGAATAAFALGDGSAAYNGLSFRPVDNRFYAVANDGFGLSSLVSFEGSGAATLTSLGALGAGFSGMAYRAAEDAFYAASTSFTGDSTLVRVTSSGGTSTVGPLGIAFMGGLAFGAAPDVLFGISADAFGVQRTLQQIDVATGLATPLFDLGDGSVAFSGGLAWDDDAGLFQIIGSDFLGDSSLFSFDLSGAASLSLVGGVGPGYLNAGLTGATVIVPPPPPPPPPPIPEPGTLALLVAAALAALSPASSSRQRRTSCA